jgi:hypothetical protein
MQAAPSPVRMSAGAGPSSEPNMFISQTKFSLFAAFWIVLIGAQYYFLYRKYYAISVCHGHHEQVDATQAQLDRTDAFISNLKK